MATTDKAKKAADETTRQANENIKNSARAASDMMEKMGNMFFANDAGAKYSEAMQQAGEIAQGQMEACAESAARFNRHAEDILKTWMDMAREAGESQAQAAKQIMSCRTLTEMSEAQSKFAQTSLEQAMTCSTRLSEMSVKLATDCFEPINEQISQSVSKARGAMAA